MEYRTLEQFEEVAKVRGNEPSFACLSRRDKLRRWAKVLDHHPNRMLNALHGTEHMPADTRDAMRANESPLSVAFQDPVLRAEGLRDDSYGEAKRFFELSDFELHEVVCYCHNGAQMRAGRGAQSVRSIRNPVSYGAMFKRVLRLLGFRRHDLRRHS